MANLNGHEVGNDGYRQEKPIATTPSFYSAREKPHARFDEGILETQLGCAPVFYSTFK
jgi:hypothetical protein